MDRKQCKACGHNLPIHYFDKEDVCYYCEPLSTDDAFDEAMKDNQGCAGMNGKQEIG